MTSLRLSVGCFCAAGIQRTCAAVMGALDFLASSACVYIFPPFVNALLAAMLIVPGFISRRQRACVKGMGKDGKLEKALNGFPSRKFEAQASSLTRLQGIFALNTDVAWNDVRSAVVAECPEYQIEAGSCSWYQQSSQSCPVRNLGSTRKGPAWKKHPLFRQKGWRVLGRRWSGEECRLLWASRWFGRT